MLHVYLYATAETGGSVRESHHTRHLRTANRNVKTPEQVAAERAEQIRREKLAKADPVWARKKLGWL